MYVAWNSGQQDLLGLQRVNLYSVNKLNIPLPKGKMWQELQGFN